MTFVGPDQSLQDFIRTQNKSRRAVAQQGSPTAAGVPTGTIIMGGWTDLPAGYFACDGAQYDQVACGALFAAIGTSYNTGGEAAGMFRVPNLSGAFPRGNTTQPGGNGGSSSHTHNLSDNAQAQITIGTTATLLRRIASSFVANLSLPSGGNAGTSSATQSTGVGLTGSTDSASTLPPYVDVTYAIKY